MDDTLPLNYGFGGSNQRKLMIATIENLLKKNLPKDRNDVSALIMYQTGLTEEKVREYIRLFFRLGKIGKDKEDDRILTWLKD